MPRTIRVAAIGECMLELSDPQDGSTSLSFGGDTLNTAVYMARLGRQAGLSVDYLTALGDDPYSDAMVNSWRGEGIGTELVRRLDGLLPGLYAIRTDGVGERTFYYWRGQSAARRMFDGEHGERLAAALAGYDLVYLSGITLSILDAPARARLLAGVDAARLAGARVAFDSNFRPRGWPGVHEARRIMDDTLGRTDIALPGLDDERQLRQVADAEACAAAIAALGVGEVCVKDGGSGCLVRHGASTIRSPARPGVTPVDTTAAGDAFNAAYLVARLAGAAPERAAAAGHRLAAAVICHRGAIIPPDAMPAATTNETVEEA